MDPHLWDIYRDIRTLIQKPDEAVYILYTSLGALTVHRFVYRAEARYVILQGLDEKGKERTVGFSEQQLSTFPLELKMKSADNNNGHIRFRPNMAESVVLQPSDPAPAFQEAEGRK